MKKRKNLAIIGIGRWGKNLLREFSKVATVHRVYHQGNPENSKWLKENYPDIKTANSYQELLTDPTIDAVVIATPIKTHYELAKKALSAGKHVFVEKPITDNVKQAQELANLSANKKLTLFVGHIFSYHPVLAKIKSIAHKEPIRNAIFVWNKWGTFGEDLMVNLGSHDIATAFDLFGQPSKVEVLEKLGIVSNSDIMFLRLHFSNRRTCTIYINRVSNFKNKTVTLVTDKNVYLWENEQLFKLDKKVTTLKLIYKSIRTPLEAECTEFIKCLEQIKKPHTSGEFGLWIVRILSRIRK